MSALRPCPFDAEAFGFPWFRVVGQADLAEALAALPATCAVDAKLPEGDPAAQTLEALGFIHVCTQVTLSRAIGDVGAAEASLTDSLTLDETELERHARNFRFDRFSHDVRLPADGRVRLYTRWLANSLSGRMRVASLPGGVATWSPERGAIDLVSVLKPGQGLGRKLVDAVLADAQAHDLPALSVTTEEGNGPALALYARCGFARLSRTLVFHLVRP